MDVATFAICAKRVRDHTAVRVDTEPTDGIHGFRVTGTGEFQYWDGAAWQIVEQAVNFDGGLL